MKAKKYLQNSLIVLLITSLSNIVPGMQAHAHETEEENTVVIHVDENGFEPQEVEIEVGSTVIFENVGTEKHWPAGDDHPSHTLYDGTSLEEHCQLDDSYAFDACRGLEPGEQWSFTFNKGGEFEYHDHLWPHLIGEIRVGGETLTTPIPKESLVREMFFQLVLKKLGLKLIPTQPQLNQVQAVGTFYEDLKATYTQIVQDADPGQAIQTLQKDSMQDGNINALCHDLLHEIGRNAYHKYGSFEAAVVYQNDFCNSGYIHGIFESYFETEENPLENISEQCENYARGRRAFDSWQCYHGVGHGFMYLTGGDLNESLQLCSEQIQDPTHQQSCHNGVYMEVFNLEVLAKEADFVQLDDPFATCREQSIDKADCYLYLPTYLIYTLGLSPYEIIEVCNQSEEGHVYTCLLGLGSESMKRNMSQPQNVFELCRQIPYDYGKQGCAVGAVSIYMNQNASYESGQILCNSEAARGFEDACEKVLEWNKDFF